MNIIIGVGGNGYNKKIVGGKANFKIIDNINKWKVHKKYGGTEFTIKTINQILALPQYVNNEQLLKQVIIEIWKAPVNKLFYAIIKNTKIDLPFHTIYKTLFWKLKEFIEIIILFHLKYVQNRDINVLLKTWKDYITSNNINTSSIILWSLFDKNNISYRKFFKGITFNYLGYCPHVPRERILLLLNFPVDFLLNDIKKKKSELDLSVDFNKLENLFEEKIKFSYTSSDINKCIKPDFVQNNVSVKEYLNNFMEAWLSLNQCLKPYFEEYEKYMISQVKKIEKFCIELENINQKLLKILHQN
jgi:hypothetical protein